MRKIINTVVSLFISLGCCFATGNICNTGNFNILDDSLTIITKNLSKRYNSENDFTAQANQLYCYSVTNSNNDLKALSANYLGFRQYIKSNTDSAYIYLKEANEILLANEPTIRLIDNLKILGLVDILEKDYVSAKIRFEETERLAKELMLKSEEIDIYNNKGLLYMELNQFEKAQEYLNMAAKFSKQKGSKIPLGYAYLNIARSKRKQNASIDTVLYYTELAFKAWSSPKHERGIAYYYNFKGVLFESIDLEKSYDYYKQAIYLTEYNNLGINLAGLYYKCAKYFIHEDNNEQAFEYALRSINISISKNNLNTLRKTHYLITKNFKFNSKDEELEYHTKINSFLLNTPDYSQKALTEMLKFETQNEELTKKNDRSALIIVFLLIGLLILGFFAALILKLLKQRTKSQKALKLLNEKINTQNIDLLNTQNLLQNSIEKLQSFAHIVSHDIKAPLRTISGFADIAIKQYETNSNQVSKSLNLIATLSKDLTKLVNDILIDASNNKIETINKVDLNKVVSKVLNKLKFDIDRNNVSIEKSELPIVKGIESKLVQLFQNLISNAITYKHPSRKLQLQLLSTKRNNNLLVSVKDNGKGIKQDLLTEIFKKNNRGEEITTKGTGLGLFTCNRIMTELSGKIKVLSNYNEGSEFILQFPQNQ